MNTKEDIINSLTKLMYEKEFQEITVKELAENAHVYRSTYYRNFKSKEDIISYKLNTIMEEYLILFEKEENKTFENYLKIIFTTFLNYKEFLLLINKHKQIYLLQQVLLNNFDKKISKSEKEDVYKIYYHMGGIYNFLICWINNGMSDSPEELTKISLNIVDESLLV